MACYSHWTWEESLLTTGFVAFALYFLLRRNVPGALLSALLILAWLAAYEPVPQLVGRWLFTFFAKLNGRPLGQTTAIVTSAVMVQLPRAVLYSVPAIAALRDIRRAGRSRPSWLEWTSLGLASALYFVSEFTELIRYYSITGGAGSWALETLIRAVVLLAALVLGLLLTRSRRAEPG